MNAVVRQIFASCAHRFRALGRGGRLRRAALIAVLLAAQLALGLHWADHHAEGSAPECAACHAAASAPVPADDVPVAAPRLFAFAAHDGTAVGIPPSGDIAGFRSRAPPAPSIL